MVGHDFTLSGVDLRALGSGALWWPAGRLLCVSDLHLGNSERIARRPGQLPTPYETRETLERLETDIADTDPASVLCLGTSFDGPDTAQSLGPDEHDWLVRLQRARRWIWIEGKHDAAPAGLAGRHLPELSRPPLTFRHIAKPGAAGEISGHYHPKAVLSAQGRQVSRPCFLIDGDRCIMPAYGCHTDGLRWDDPVFAPLLRREALALLTGPMIHALPVRRVA